MMGEKKLNVLISVLAHTYDRIFVMEPGGKSGWMICGDTQTEVADFDEWCSQHYKQCYAGDDFSRFIQKIQADEIKKVLTYEDDYAVEFSEREEDVVRRKRLRAFVCGEEAFLCAGVEDISEEYEREQVRDRLEKECLLSAQQANIAKEQFWQQMDGEIRVPVYEAIQMLNKAVLADGEVDGEQVTKARRALNRYYDMVSQMFTVSSIEKGEEPEQEDVVIPDELLGQLEHILGEEENDSGRPVCLENICPKVGVFLTDAVRLKQLLVNLLGAAALYDAEHAVRGELDFDMLEETEEEPEVFDFLFRVKVRGDAEKLRKDIRMTYAFRLADYMNGVLKLEAEEEQTEILLRIPVQKADKEVEKEYLIVSHMRDSINDRDFSRFRALVADDDEISREITVAMLKRMGLEVDTAEDGQEAIDMLLAAPFRYYQILFMKMFFPGKTGLEATMEIREMERQDLNDITIVAFTANPLRDKRISALEHGMDYHIILPYDEIQLKDILIRELQNMGPRDEYEKFGFRVLK